MSGLLQNPYQVYTDLNGDPMDNGYVYIGMPNQNPITNPISVFWDAAATIPATQPLRTQNGYIVNAGSPATVYVLAMSYSATIKDAGMVQVYYLPFISPSGIGSGFAPLDSPHFTGVPTVPTGAVDLATSQAASQAFVIAQIASTASRNYLNVKDAPYNAKGDGIANDVAAIQSALNDLVSFGGGTLFIPAGTYNISTVLNIGSNVGITVLGANRDSTVIQTMATTSGIFNVTGWNVVLQSLTFFGNSTQTGGVFANMAGAFGRVLDCKFKFDSVGIKMSGVACRIENCIFDQSSPGGYRIWATGGDTSQIIDNCLMLYQLGNFPVAGIYVDSSSALMITNTSIISQGIDLYVNCGPGKAVFSLYVENCFFDTASTGIVLSTSGSGAIQRCRFTDCWASSHQNNGISIIQSGGGSISGMHFVNCHTLINTLSGFSLTGGVADITIDGGMICGNTQHGVYVAGGISDFSIIGATIGIGAGSLGNAGWGILVSTGSSDRYIISNNRMFGNTLGTLSDGGTGTNKTVANNVPSTGGGGGGGGITALTGDVTASGTGSVAATLSNSGVTAGAYGSGTSIPTITVDAKGRVIAVSTNAIGATSISLTGDATGIYSAGTIPVTLAASGVAAGTYGTLASFPIITVDNKGRVTSAGQNIVQAYAIKGLVARKATTGAGGTVTVSFSTDGFTTAPAVVATAEASGPGVAYTCHVSSITTAGATIQVVNAGGTLLPGVGVYYFAVGPT